MMADIRFRRTFRTIFVTGRRAGMPIAGEGDSSPSRPMLCYGISILFYLMYKVVCTVYSIINIEQFHIRVYLLAALSYFCASVILFAFYLLSRERFESLIDNVDRLTTKVLTSGFGHYQVFTDIYYSTAERLTKFSNLFAVLSFLCPGVFCISVPVVDLVNGRYRQRTAVPAQCPFELVIQQEPIVFELIVLQQVLAYAIPGFFMYLTECIMLGLFKTHEGFFKFLSITLKEIGEDMLRDCQTGRKNVIYWIKLHQQVMQNSRELVNVFSPAIVAYYLLNIVLVAGSLLYMMDAESSNILQSVFGGGYMAMSMLMLYLLCHAAHDMTSEAEKLAFEAYSIPWYQLDRSTRIYVSLIINIGNRPFNADAYRSPAFRLSREAYQALFVNTVSAYMGFNKIREMGAADDTMDQIL